MENNENTNVTPEATTEEVVAVKPEEVKEEVATDVTGQPIVDESSFVKTPEQIKAERKEKWKKLVFGDKTAEKKEPIDKQDVLCYLGAFLCFLLGLLPFLLRTFDPMYDRDLFFDKGDDEEKEVLNYKKLHCSKKNNQTGYSYIIATEGVYGNNILEKLTITYSVTIEDTNITFDQIDIPEYTEFSAIDSDAITENVQEPDYKVVIDMKKESINKYKTQPPLNAHVAILPSQRENYTNAGYSCIVESIGESNESN